MVQGALSWVSPALGTHLEQIRGRLDQLRDPETVRLLQEQWAPVSAALQLAGFQLGHGLVSELDHLTRVLLRGTAGCRGDILRALMTGVVGLENQLKQAKPGRRETSLSLLGLIDDARAVRKLPPLSGDTLFFPGIDKPTPPRNVPDVGVQHREPEDLARELHPVYRQGIATLAQDPMGSEGAAALYGVAARLLGACDTAEGKRLWWLVTALCEALREARAPASPAVRGLLSRIEPEIARLAILGEARFNARLPKALLRNLLFRIALVPGNQGQIGTIKRAYQLEDLLPGAAQPLAGEESVERLVFDNLRQRVAEGTVKIRHQLEALGRSRRYRAELYAEMAAPLAQIADVAAMLGEVAASEQLESLAFRVEAIATGREEAHDRGLWAMVAVLFRVEKRMTVLKTRTTEQAMESSLFPELPDYRLDALTGALGMVEGVRTLLRNPVKSGAERFALEAIWALRRATHFAAKADDDVSAKWLLALANWLAGQPRDNLLSRPELKDFTTVLTCVWCRLDAGVTGRRYPRDPVPIVGESLKRMGVDESLHPVPPPEPPEPPVQFLIQPVISLNFPEVDEEGIEQAEATDISADIEDEVSDSSSLEGEVVADDQPVPSRVRAKAEDTLELVLPDASAESPVATLMPVPQVMAPADQSIAPTVDVIQTDELVAEELPREVASESTGASPRTADVVVSSENLEGALDLLESLVQDFESKSGSKPPTRKQSSRGA